MPVLVDRRQDSGDDRDSGMVDQRMQERMLLSDARVEDGHSRGVSRRRLDALGVHELALVIARETVCACVCWAGDSIHVRGKLGDVEQHLACKSHEVDVALGPLEGHRIGTVLVA